MKADLLAAERRLGTRRPDPERELLEAVVEAAGVVSDTDATMNGYVQVAPGKMERLRRALAALRSVAAGEKH